MTRKEAKVSPVKPELLLTRDVLIPEKEAVPVNARVIIARLNGPEDKALWSRIERATSIAYLSNSTVGRAGVSDSFAAAVAALRHRIGWFRTDPEVLLLSAQYYEEGLRRRVRQMESGIEDIDSGKRKFIDDPFIDYAERTRNAEEEQVGVLRGDQMVVDERITEFADTLLHGTMQRNVLTALPSIGQYSQLRWIIPDRFQGVVENVGKNKYPEAYELLVKEGVLGNAQTT